MCVYLVMTKFRIRQTQWGNWYGYLGTKKAEQFFGTPEEQEQAAKEWLAESTPLPLSPVTETDRPSQESDSPLSDHL